MALVTVLLRRAKFVADYAAVTRASARFVWFGRGGAVDRRPWALGVDRCRSTLFVFRCVVVGPWIHPVVALGTFRVGVVRSGRLSAGRVASLLHAAIFPPAACLRRGWRIRVGA
jgi:hypothetical protein